MAAKDKARYSVVDCTLLVDTTDLSIAEAADLTARRIGEMHRFMESTGRTELQVESVFFTQTKPKVTNYTDGSYDPEDYD